MCALLQETEPTSRSMKPAGTDAHAGAEAVLMMHAKQTLESPQHKASPSIDLPNKTSD
jgi:hypothetical protein